MIEFIILLLISFYCWVVSFLVHELMHIKGDDITSTGKINVHKFSLSATSDIPSKKRWLWYAGGILSGLIHIIIGALLWYYGIWVFYVPFITCGVINFIYGLWEGTYGGKDRHTIYIIGLGIMIAFWIVYFGVQI